MVLVEPENPDNIGAVARAMKNMGLRNLRLVKPPRGWKRRGRKMAMKARDTLESARVFETVKEAVSDARLVIGTTRRMGPKRGLFIPFQTALQKLTAMPQSRAAILFGKESKGLSNRDLAMCDWVTTLPSHSDYSSINLAQAVMIIGFSIFTSQPLTPTLSLKGEGENKFPLSPQAGRGSTQFPLSPKGEGDNKFPLSPQAGRGSTQFLLSPKGEGDNKFPLSPQGRGQGEGIFVSKKEMNSVLERFREALSALNYEQEGRDVHERIVATLHRLLKRGGLLTSEARMLKGLSRRICERYNTLHG